MKYLGVDFGMRRIGLAVSEGELATPLKILEGKNLLGLVNQVVNIFEQGNFEELVIGKPEGETGKLADNFIKELKKKNLNVVVVDETLSSVNALHSMIRSGAGKKKRGQIDAEAAAGILQDYLDGLRE